MKTGQARDSAGQRKKTVALIALTSEAGRMSVSYRLSGKASASTRRKIAGKLLELVDELKG